MQALSRAPYVSVRNRAFWANNTASGNMKRTEPNRVKTRPDKYLRAIPVQHGMQEVVSSNLIGSIPVNPADAVSWRTPLVGRCGSGDPFRE